LLDCLGVVREIMGSRSGRVVGGAVEQETSGLALADAGVALLDVGDGPAKPKNKRHPRDLKAKQAALLALQADVAQRAAALAQPVVVTETAAPLVMQAPPVVATTPAAPLATPAPTPIVATTPAPVVATMPAVMKKKPFPRPLADATVDALEKHAAALAQQSALEKHATLTSPGVTSKPDDGSVTATPMIATLVTRVDEPVTAVVERVDEPMTAVVERVDAPVVERVDAPLTAPVVARVDEPMTAVVARVDETATMGEQSEPMDADPTNIEMVADTLVMEPIDLVVTEPLVAVKAGFIDEADAAETSPNQLRVEDVVKHAQERAAKAEAIKLAEFDVTRVMDVAEVGVFNEEPTDEEPADNTNSTPRVKVAVPDKPAAALVVVEDDNSSEVPTGVLPKLTDVLVSPLGSNDGWAERRPTPWKTHAASSSRRRAVALAASFAAVVGCFGGIARAAANPIRFEMGGSTVGEGLPWGVWVAIVVVVAGVATGVLFVMRRRQAWAARMVKQGPPASRAEPEEQE